MKCTIPNLISRPRLFTPMYGELVEPHSLSGRYREERTLFPPFQESNPDSSIQLS
jgi:hypothetical protein